LGVTVGTGQNIPIAAPAIVAIKARVATATPGLASIAFKRVTAVQEATIGPTDNAIFTAMAQVYSAKSVE
jgi:hypothetical protein